MMEGIEIRDWDQLTAELVFIYDGLISPNHLRLNKHIYDQVAILIREGHALVTTEAGTVEAGAGNWIFPKSGNRFQEFTPGSRVLSVHFLLAWPGGFPVYDWDVALVVPAKDEPALEEAGMRLSAVINEVLPGQGKAVRQSKSQLPPYFRIYGYFYQWLEHYSRVLQHQGVTPIRMGQADPRVLKILQILDHHPFRISINQTELAAKVGLSSNQLARLFRQQFRVTPAIYLERRRVKEAFARVQNSSDPFKEIAYELGFYSPSHFSTWFSAKFRHTPREVRAQGRALFPREL